MPFLNRSISTRLLFLVTLTIVIAVIAFGSVSTWREISSYKQFRINQLSDQSKILAKVVAPDMAKDNKNSTFRNLSVVGTLSSIDFIDVINPAGKSFASLGDRTIVTTRNLDLGKQKNLFALLRSHTVSYETPIVFAGKQIGVLNVYRKTNDLKPQVILIFLTTLLIAGTVLFVGLIAAWFIQRSVTVPISSLTRAMKNIEETGNYNNMLDHRSLDEFDGLIESFNKMVTRVRERDEKLDAHRRTLESRVELRTRQYKDAMQTAEKANKAKSDFLAMISHEIRTPLNGMLVMAELLTKADLYGPQKRHAEVVFDSGKTLLSIINDILDLSKIEAGKMDLEIVPFNPRESINSVIRLYQEKAEKIDVKLEYEIDPDVGEIMMGDPVRIGQILNNLVNNALKFTEDGFVKIHARNIPNPDSVPITYFSVEDSGIGIAKDKQAAVFESFSQADQSTTRLYGGTGLGLSICQSLVESMKGKIGLESQEGKGSRFWFAIPTPAPSTKELKEIQTRSAKTKKDIFEGLNNIDCLKILIADDNPINIEVLTEALTQLGAKPEAIDSVGDGQEAINVAQSGRYDLIFMDGSMPKVDGFQATKIIRKWERDQNRSPMSIIALTAHVAGKSSGEYLTSGMDDLITKPFSIDTIANCLREYSGKHIKHHDISA